MLIPIGVVLELNFTFFKHHQLPIFAGGLDRVESSKLGEITTHSLGIQIPRSLLGNDDNSPAHCFEDDIAVGIRYWKISVSHDTSSYTQLSSHGVRTLANLDIFLYFYPKCCF